jgi:serine/threonine protein kinase
MCLRSSFPLTATIIMSWITCSNGHRNLASSRFCEYCGESLLKHQIHTAIGTDLKPAAYLRQRYRIQSPIGQGGFGKTYLAEDTGRFHELVVIKELTPLQPSNTNLQKIEELFQREAAMLHKLQHPQIPRFWDYFKEDNHLFLVQDFIEGKTYQDLLQDRLQEGNLFNEIEIIQLFSQLLPVLSYLHHQGIIHRDISPDNIICREQDRMPVLIDFGGVKTIAFHGIASPVSATGTRLGKIGYAPDEQMQQGIVAPHSDLYALAVTGLVLMTGKSPQELSDPFTMAWIWEQQLPHLTPQFKAILKQMLALQPVDRFQYAEEVLSALESFKNAIYNPTQAVSPRYSPQVSSATPTLNNSGQGNVFNKSFAVPDEIVGWNWGAFLLPGFWCLTNQVWVGLIVWVDLSMVTLGCTRFIMGLVLGANGNEWAWKSRRWSSITAFKAHQRMWTIIGLLVWSFLLMIVGVILALLLSWGWFSFLF